jgi:mono/diheme cytochrome c family protein
MKTKSLRFVQLAVILTVAFIVPLAVLSADNAKKESSASQATLDEGQQVFKKNCNLCHFPDKPDKKMGPGLKGLFSLEELPESHKPVDEKTIRDQIMNGTKKMPGFAKKLSPEQVDSLIAYLKTL